MSRRTGKGAKSVPQTKQLPPQGRKNLPGEPEAPPAALLLLHDFLNTLRVYYKYLGPVIVIICIFHLAPPVDTVKDVIYLLITAPPENTQAAGQALASVIEVIFGRAAWMVAAVLFGTNLVTAFALYLCMRNNRRHIFVLGDQRKLLEQNDPGGRTSSGLNEYGDRP